MLFSKKYLTCICFTGRNLCRRSEDKAPKLGAWKHISQNVLEAITFRKITANLFLNSRIQLCEQLREKINSIKRFNKNSHVSADF